MKYKTTQLIIVPAIILIASFSLRKAQGPFYFDNHYDPAYAYLISSLNLSELKDHNFYVHPGTPEQILGAVVIKLVYFSDSDYNSAAFDVFSKPEKYLNVFFSLITILNFLSIFLSGLIVYKATGNIFLSILIQLSVIVSYTISHELSMIKPDNLIVPVTLLLVAMIIKYMYNSTKENTNNIEIIFALLCGIGLSTKLIFFPLVTIPLLMIKGLRGKLIFSLFTIIFFLLLLFPIYPYFSNFILWVKNLFLHSGKYGTGNADVVDPGLFQNNLKEIFNTHKFLLITIFFIIAYMGLNFLFNILKKRAFLLRTEDQLLFVIFVSIIITIILVAKQYSPRYLFPALLLIPLSCYLIFSGIIDFFDIKRKYIIDNIFCIILSMFILINFIKSTREAINWSELKRSESVLIDEFIDKNFKDSTLLICYGSTSIEYALAFTLPFSGSQKLYIEKILKNKFQDLLFYEPWVKKIHSIGGTENVGDILNSNGNIFIKLKVMNDVNSTALYDIQTELQGTYNYKAPVFIKLFSNSSNESIYQVILK